MSETPVFGLFSCPLCGFAWRVDSALARCPSCLGAISKENGRKIDPIAHTEPPNPQRDFFVQVREPQHEIVIEGSSRKRRLQQLGFRPISITHDSVNGRTEVLMERLPGTYPSGDRRPRSSTGHGTTTWREIATIAVYILLSVIFAIVVFAVLILLFGG